MSLDVKVRQSPRKFYKGVTAKTTPDIIHICDIENNEYAYAERMKNILSEMKEAKKQKGIEYMLGYSNLTFELWMILHKRDCAERLNSSKQYLARMNAAFGERFENLDQYKQNDNFKRCLSKLCISDVLTAITRAESITHNNEKNMARLIEYKGYSYFRDNPSLSIHKVVKMIMCNSGITV